jgi:hypothetical protein
VGFFSEEVYPSPNDQTQPVGEFVEVSTNWTTKGMVPVVTGETKDATGREDAALTVMKPVFVTVSLPAAFVAVRVTV